MPRAPWHVSSGTLMPNPQAFQIGWRSGERLSLAAIALAVGCGLTPQDVVRVWLEFDYAPPSPLPPGVELVPVMISAKDRTRIAAEAKVRGADMSELAGEALSRMVRDDLFAAVFDR